MDDLESDLNQICSSKSQNQFKQAIQNIQKSIKIEEQQSENNNFLIQFKQENTNINKIIQFYHNLKSRLSKINNLIPDFQLDQIQNLFIKSLNFEVSNYDNAGQNITQKGKHFYFTADTDKLEQINSQKFSSKDSVLIKFQVSGDLKQFAFRLGVCPNNQLLVNYETRANCNYIKSDGYSPRGFSSSGKINFIDALENKNQINLIIEINIQKGKILIYEEQDQMLYQNSYKFNKECDEWSFFFISCNKRKQRVTIIHSALQ